jgi:hypothetical protein
MFVAVMFLVGIGSVGFYRGWFQLSTDSADQKSSATITVDKGRIHTDEQKVKDEMQSFRHAAKEKTS